MYTSLLNSAYQSASTCHRCTNAFALAQVVAQNRVPFDMVAERLQGTPRVETLESLEGQAQDHGSSSSGSNSSRIVNRHGHLNTILPHFSSSETGNDRRDTTIKSGSDETVSDRLDMLKCINTALQNMSAASTASKQYRIIDFIPRNWEGSNDKGYFETSCQTCVCKCKRGQTRRNNVGQR